MILELVLLAALLVFLVYVKTAKPAQLPPGSFGFPVIGSLPPSTVTVTDHLLELRNKYGKIYTTKWGSRVVVVLADHLVIKKALSHPDLQGRVDFYSTGLFYNFKNLGVLFSIHDVWKDNRRFLLRNLRDLGMGKTRMEISIQEEAEMLVNYLEQHNLDKATEIDWSINVAVLNVIWQMLASKRYDADDSYIIRYNKMVTENVAVFQGPIFILDMMPWLQRLCPQRLLEGFFRAGVMVGNRNALNAMFLETIHEHEAILDRDNPRDVIDNYIVEMKMHKHETQTTGLSDYWDLLAMMADMFAAGSETTSTTLRWFILYMAMFPEIQQKAQRVLDEVVPVTRLPSLDDKDQLPYVDALILDTLRLSSLVPNAVPHCATATVSFEGYTIPEGAMILPCLELCHRDPKLWERPDSLYPEHFLDETGKLDSKKDGFMPFSLGRRQCLGESLARMEMFLFMSAILQRFTISAPPGVVLKGESDSNKRLINQPKSYKVVLKKRI